MAHGFVTTYQVFSRSVFDDARWAFIFLLHNGIGYRCPETGRIKQAANQNPASTGVEGAFLLRKPGKDAGYYF